MSNLRPNFSANNVESLTPQVVEDLGVEAVAFDVDGTLSDYHADQVEPSVVRMLKNLGDRGLKTVIISNAYGSRVDRLNEIYSNLITGEVITPASLAEDGKDSHQFRKPSPKMLIRASLDLGVEPDKMLMVGDQILKDVLSANRAGAKSLLVPRRGTGDFWPVRSFQRPLEAAVRLGMGITLGSSQIAENNND